MVNALVRLGVVLAAVTFALGCATESVPRATSSTWEFQMQSGVEAVARDEPAVAVEHFGRAIELARQRPRRGNQLANATWHLADVCFRHPGSCQPGGAWRETLAAYEIFAAHYGPEHPVVIPVLLRLSEIRAREGDLASARALLDQADRITARWFPESHFMRARMGDHRPAASLHPRELLQILAEIDLLDG
jgi:hypothetical protein